WDGPPARSRRDPASSLLVEVTQVPLLDRQLRILVGLDRQLLRDGQLRDHVRVPLVALDSQVHVAVRAQVLDADHMARKRSALKALPVSRQAHVFGTEA